MDKSTFLPTILMAPCCEWSPPNSEQWAIARRVHSPPFQGGVAAPLIKRSRSLAAQTGWFVNSNKNKVRYADIHKEATRPFTNHPVCAAEERDLLLRRSHPSLKTEGNELASTAVIDFEIACLRQAPEIRVSRTTSTHFATCGTVLIGD